MNQSSYYLTTLFMVMLGKLVKKYINNPTIQIILTLSSRNITRHKLYKVS